GARDARRSFLRLRSDVAQGRARAPRERVRAAALPGGAEAPEPRLLRDLGACDRQHRQGAADDRARVESGRLRQQRDAPYRRAGDVSGVRASSRAAVAAALLAAAAGHAADKPIDPKTGLVIDEGIERASARRTACHAGGLVTQTGRTRARWLEAIRGMQDTRGLWGLGEKEDEVLDYLARNYGVPERPAQPGVIPLPR